MVRAEREVALLSNDHLHPWGTRRDNSVNRRFNDKLYRLYPPSRQLCVMDLGCSGGGFVKSCHDDGCRAIGLEGSDFSKHHRRAEWRTIPELLFTCDITRPFEVLTEESGKWQRLLFDVVTAWEVIEHIAEPDLAQVADNVKQHLAPGGLWIMSVSTIDDVVDGIRLHQTVKGKPWWQTRFAELGLVHHEPYVRYFNTQFVRGKKYGAPGSFHLVLSRHGESGPIIPAESLLRRLNDLWIGSVPQRIISGTY